MSREGLPAQLGLVPVTVGHTGTGDPDLANLSRPGATLLLWIDNDDLLIGQTVTAADQRLRTRLLRVSRDNLVGFQGGLVHTQGQRRRMLVAAGDHQCGLGQSIAGIESFAAKT